MAQLTTELLSIQYDTKMTTACPVRLEQSLYIEDQALPRYLIGTSTLNLFEYYQAECPQLQKNDYQLTEQFQQIINRFPHTNQQVQFDGKGSYRIKEVPICITTKDYLLALLMPEHYPDFNEQLTKLSRLQFLKMTTDCQRKRLYLDGTFGSRALIEGVQEAPVQAIQKKLTFGEEYYYFGFYTYAGTIQFLPEYQIETYEQFHEAYGKYIYSVTLKKGNQVVPLLCPDYLYHQPENHLEFGLLADTEAQRYAPFQQWKAGEEIAVEILAEGFEDVVLTTTMKQALKQRPMLSKMAYSLGEDVILSVDAELLAELDHQAQLTVLKGKECMNHPAVICDTKEERLILVGEQFTEAGHYQLKINRSNYGQLLFLFMLREEH
jgi:hypothetical protein